MSRFSVMFLFLCAPLRFASDCIPEHEAGRHVGESKCVAGKILRVKVGAKGVLFLDFCEDQMACPFTVVVFPSGLKDAGDVRRLAGRTVEIHGDVKLYGGRAEIILNRIGQITGGAAIIPPRPKNYDVANRGHYSAGHLRPPGSRRRPRPHHLPPLRMGTTWKAQTHLSKRKIEPTRSYEGPAER
jgi:hypothetical protein